MQISLKWINELVDIKEINLNNLIEKLTFGGFEVEEILEIKIDNKKEIVLDISATANRSDSLSIQGISTEIAALLDKPINISTYSIKFRNWNKIILDNTTNFPKDHDCSIFSSIVVENLTDTSVPKWITQKLLSSSLTPSNDLLDCQNYILLETGYPFLFYDFDKIRSELDLANFELSILKAKNDQEFTASNNQTYKLTNSILVVNANQIPISIAGIIENQKFAYSKNTTSLLIEGSIFNAAKIRQQSRNLGLRTERSAKYEKSVRTNDLGTALYRLISLLRIANPNLICQFHTVYQTKERVLEPIVLRYETINEILGPINSFTNFNSKYISPKIISSYLTRLNFKFHFNELKLNWEVQIPKLRSEDITREIDLIEEIGRLHGYNNFLTILPKLNIIGNEDSTSKTRKKITTCFLNLGFTELIHYSLVNQTTFLKNEIELLNPLLADYSSLRTSLLPNLIKTVQENLKQKNLSIEGFEYGHVFSLDLKKKIIEKEFVAGIFGGVKTKLSWTNLETPITWFEAKGKLEQLFHQLNLSTYWQPTSKIKTEKLLQPYRSAEIYLSDGTNLGNFGQIHPLLANKLNVSDEIYLFEFEIEVINSQLQKNRLIFYNSYSVYPKILKDLSILIQKDITFENIQKVLYANGTEFLSEINLLDKYEGASIPDQKTSLCIQLIFQSNTKTLENKIIESILKKLQQILTQKFAAIIRE